MHADNSQSRPSVRHESDNLPKPTPRQQAAYGRLQDLLMQIEELKSVAWMLDETTTRLCDWSKAVPSVSLLHREISEVSSSLDRIHDDLGGLFVSPAKANQGGAA